MTIDPGTSSVVPSSSCLVALLLAIFWAGFSRFLVLASERGFLCLSKNLNFISKQGRTSDSLWKTLSIVFGSSKGENCFENTLKWHEMKTLLHFDDGCYVYLDAKQNHSASFSTLNSTLNTSLRWPIRMRDFIQLCDSIKIIACRYQLGAVKWSLIVTT